MTTLPNFLGIGVQRAATTWLHQCLAEHPDVFVPDAKELHFFSSDYERGLAWYEGCFAGSSGRTAVGEITPTYMHEAPIERIAQLLPAARLFVVLREPVSRAISAYQLLHEKYAGMSFTQACESSDYFVHHSLYYQPLSEVFRHYPRDRVKVLLYDEVIADPHHVLAELFTYLGVDPTFVPPSTHRVYNRISRPWIEALLKHRVARWMATGLKRTPLVHLVRGSHTLKKNDSAAKNGNERAFQQGLKARFRDDILKVQDLIGRDLSAWL
jgi:hypothetical protein